MTRTTLWLIALFALIAAACVAFGAYFSYVTLLNAHRSAMEQRFSITVERLVSITQHAASLGIALPAQTTLADVLRREAEIERAIAAIDVVDNRGVVLFSSDPARVGLAEVSPRAAVARPVTDDIGEVIGRVVLHYDAKVLAAGAAVLERDLSLIALPTLAAACLATILIGLLLALNLRRAARRAAHPQSWPAAARAAIAAAEAAQGAVNGAVNGAVDGPERGGGAPAGGTVEARS